MRGMDGRVGGKDRELATTGGLLVPELSKWSQGNSPTGFRHFPLGRMAVYPSHSTNLTEHQARLWGPGMEQWTKAPALGTGVSWGGRQKTKKLMSHKVP